jgi:NAD(P)-dependent dehydrogenase (short-subunit alcohol dehydrogenase family)
MFTINVPHMSEGLETRPFDLSLFSLAGRTAVITGASRNIGAAMAMGFAAAGADLVMVARDPVRLAAHADAVRERTGRQVVEVALDVTVPEAAETIEAAAAKLPGTVDILVNNAFANGSVLAPVVDTPESVWQEVLTTNLLAPVRLSSRFAAALAQSGHGAIINVVSGSGLLPTPNAGAYGASKAALWMATRSLAAELAPAVRVNALCPGLTTPDGQPLDHAAHQHLLPLVPFRRPARAEEIVGAAVYLASDAASYTTGELLIVNGGRPW